MYRTVINCQTGEQTQVPLTQEEIDSKIAAANDPTRLAEIARQQALEDARLAAKADATVQYLRDHTIAEVDDYIQSQVTDLASAKIMLRRFGAVLCVLTKESLR